MTIDLVELVLGVLLCACIGAFIGAYWTERQVANRFKSIGRCLLQGDLYHVMLINSEIPKWQK